MPGCDVGVQPLLLCPRSLSEDVLSGLGVHRYWPEIAIRGAGMLACWQFLGRVTGYSPWRPLVVASVAVLPPYAYNPVPKRNSFSRLWPAQMSSHSRLTSSKPRRRNCRKPRPCLI